MSERVFPILLSHMNELLLRRRGVEYLVFCPFWPVV